MYISCIDEMSHARASEDPLGLLSGSTMIIIIIMTMMMATTTTALMGQVVSFVVKIEINRHTDTERDYLQTYRDKGMASSFLPFSLYWVSSQETM